MFEQLESLNLRNLTRKRTLSIRRTEGVRDTRNLSGSSENSVLLHKGRRGTGNLRHGQSGHLCVRIGQQSAEDVQDVEGPVLQAARIKKG